MRRLLAATILTLAATTALADYVDKPASGTVAETADRLVQAAEGAGATVFARVPHSRGAMSVDMELPDAELVIFGNPKLGTPAMQADMRAGLVLPLRVLIHDAGGQTTITYESVDAMFEGLEIPAEAAYRDSISGALDKLTGAASGN